MKIQWKKYYHEISQDEEYKKKRSEWIKKRKNEIKETNPKKYEELKKKRYAYTKRQRKEKPWFRAKRAATKRLMKVKAKKGIPKYEKDITIGIDAVEFKEYIESLWREGMSWDNYGRTSNPERYWEIDHIIALKAFDLWNYEEALKANHYTNLQPIWHEDHKKKTSEE